MDLKQLRHFKRIAECGSISAASHLLHIAQPALSRQMRALEHDLGVDLFHRTGRGVVLTAAGEALADEAQRLLSDADHLSQRIRSFGTVLSGEATIGLSPTIGRMLTLPLAMRVRNEFPNVVLRISEAFSGTLLEWLQDGRIDAAILYHRPATHAVRTEVVAEESLSIIGCPDALPYPVGTAISIAALAGKSVVLSTPNHGLRRMVDAHAARSGAALNVIFEFDSLEPTIALVKSGIALTILPAAAVRLELDSGALAAWPITDPELMRPLVIATGPQRPDAIASRHVADILRTTIHSAASTFGWRRV